MRDIFILLLSCIFYGICGFVIGWGLADIMMEIIN